MKRQSLLAFAMGALAASDGAFRMTNNAPSSTEPLDVAPGDRVEAEVNGKTATAVVVPDAHVNTVARIVALLERGEQWVLDNIEAGVGTLERLLKDRDIAEGKVDPEG